MKRKQSETKNKKSTKKRSKDLTQNLKEDLQSNDDRWFFLENTTKDTWCYGSLTDCKIPTSSFKKNHTCKSPQTWTPVDPQLASLLESSVEKKETSLKWKHYKIELFTTKKGNQMSLRFGTKRCLSLQKIDTKKVFFIKPNLVPELFTREDSKYFEEWMQKISKEEIVSSPTYQLVPEKKTSLVFQQIRMYLKSCSKKLVSIQKIINPSLLVKYLLKKKEMNNKLEVIGFHGSSLEDPHSICTYGLDQRLSNSRCILGRGIYGARDVNYSLDYYAHYDTKTKTNQVFLCRFLLGEVAIEPILDKGNLPPRNFNSACTTKGGIISVYENSQCVPLYLLSFSLN